MRGPASLLIVLCLLGGCLGAPDEPAPPEPDPPVPLHQWSFEDGETSIRYANETLKMSGPVDHFILHVAVDEPVKIGPGFFSLTGDVNESERDYRGLFLWGIPVGADIPWEIFQTHSAAQKVAVQVREGPVTIEHTVEDPQWELFDNKRTGMAFETNGPMMRLAPGEWILAFGLTNADHIEVKIKPFPPLRLIGEPRAKDACHDLHGSDFHSDRAVTTGAIYGYQYVEDGVFSIEIQRELVASIFSLEGHYTDAYTIDGPHGKWRYDGTLAGSLNRFTEPGNYTVTLNYDGISAGPLVTLCDFPKAPPLPVG